MNILINIRGLIMKLKYLASILVTVIILIIACQIPMRSIVSKTETISDYDNFFDQVQEATFRYFYDGAHPNSGMAMERYPFDDDCAVGGTGMGLMALIVGAERGFESRSDIAAHVLKILKFLDDPSTDRFHGAWPHWLDGNTGETKVTQWSPSGDKTDDGADLVETAFLMQGILTVNQYFTIDNTDENEIQQISDNLWSEEGNCVEWEHFLHYDSGNKLAWHWSLNWGWDMGDVIDGYNEAMIAYLLAIACPNTNHDIPVSKYKDGWARGGGEPYLDNNAKWYGYNQYIAKHGDLGRKGMQLFWFHYSFLGFDPRGKNDGIIPAGVTYYDVSRNNCLIDNAYCSTNPYEGYSSKVWGLTSSYDPISWYSEHYIENDNGTISPTAALSSIVYTPSQSIAAMKEFYLTYGDNLWGRFGFRDAYNLDQSWYSDGYLAIDQGPIIVMIENYRTQLLWKLFMSHWDIGDPTNPNNLLKKLEAGGWVITDVTYD